MKLIKRPDPDGTFALLDGKGNAVAIGLPEQDADARIAAEAAIDTAAAGTATDVAAEAASNTAAGATADTTAGATADTIAGTRDDDPLRKKGK